MPLLDAEGQRTGEFGEKLYEKTTYDPEVISDERYKALGSKLQ